LLGTLALRIDHIGSTAVPALAAKDIIDLQVTVADLEDMAAFEHAMVREGGYRRRGLLEDHVPLSRAGSDPAEWRKCFFREPDGARRTHIHVRQLGRENQRYALLFRDYLRNHPASARLYEQLKRRLAELFPTCVDAYLYIKDPVCDLIMQSAHIWCEDVQWQPGPSDA
jgi:GrpB-like predicted nucleotidyltransferase (UPF0157 family)